MRETTPHLKLLEDALGEETRKERRNLLIANALGIAVVKAGLVPKQINAFGVVTDVNESGLLAVLVGITVYFLIAFLVYAYSDFMTYTYKLNHEIAKRMEDFNTNHDEYKFLETREGKMLMQTYVPHNPQHEKLFALQAQLREKKKSYNSEEVEKLAVDRSRSLMDLRYCEHLLETRLLPISKKAKEKIRRDMDDLRVKLKDLNRMLAALGAKELIELQDEESLLNASIAAVENRKVARYYEETGLDVATSLRFVLPGLLRFFVDFVVPIGTAAYAIVCMLRSH